MPAFSSSLSPCGLLVTGAAVLSLASFTGSAVTATHCVSPDGKHGCSSTISGTVSAASPGDVIQVSPGVYQI